MTTQKEKPITRRDHEVKAILDGRKTVMRIIVKPQPCKGHEIKYRDYQWVDTYMTPIGEMVWIGDGKLKAPYSPGDILWVRETWADNICGCERGVSYKADHIDPNGDGPANPIKWKHSIFMPRWACRLFLRVVDVRPERLQEITIGDCHAEGAPFNLKPGWVKNADGTESVPVESQMACKWFKKTWDTINGKRAPWESNPWVWRVEFEKLDGKPE